EANIQALWIYRNYYKKEYKAKNAEIGVIFSTDSHYSFYKGCNLLSINPLPVEVDFETRQIELNSLKSTIAKAKEEGIKYLVVNVNMSTTMFGSVDDLEAILPTLKECGLPYKVHADGA